MYQHHCANPLCQYRLFLNDIQVNLHLKNDSIKFFYHYDIPVAGKLLQKQELSAHVQ